MFIKKNNLAILLFSSTPKSEETKLYVDINNIPPDIDILDFSYKGDLSSNLVEKDLSYLNNSVNNIFIDSFKFNQLESNKNWIDHKDLRNGGVVDFEMSNAPNLDWGSAINSVPFSMTKIK